MSIELRLANFEGSVVVVLCGERGPNLIASLFSEDKKRRSPPHSTLVASSSPPFSPLPSNRSVQPCKNNRGVGIISFGSPGLGQGATLVV
jgi:hypothetical protein